MTQSTLKKSVENTEEKEVGGMWKRAVRGLRGNKGQPTLEYLLILAAIVVALIVIGRKVIYRGTEKTLLDSEAVLNKAGSELQKGIFGSTTGTATSPVVQPSPSPNPS